MIDKVTVTDPGFNWDWWWYTGYAIGAVALIALLFWGFSFMSTSRDSAERLRSVSWIMLILVAIAVPLGAAVNGIVSGTMRTTNIEAEKDRQIEELGISES